MFSFHDAASQLGFPLYLPQYTQHANGASIDSRTLNPGEVFVALTGLNSDGHVYLETAFKNGAAGAVILDAFFNKNRAKILENSGLFRNILAVPDTKEALTKLAQWHRTRFDIPIIGVTGSVGKTSTKDFLNYLLSLKSACITTQGNQNNELGVPLTLLRIHNDAKCCVCELGASTQGEIRLLANIAKPTAGIITGISHAHLEGFGSLENIYSAKSELFECLKAGSTVVLPDYDVELRKRAGRFDLMIRLVGETSEADYRIESPRSEGGRILFSLNGRMFSFPGFALFQSRNAGMAIAMAEACGVSIQDLPEYWEGIEFAKGRFRIYETDDGIRIIDDSYNASPYSFSKAIETFSKLDTTGRKLLVLSDMLELGQQTKHFHEALAEEIAAGDFSAVVGYGAATMDCLDKLRELKPSMTVKKASGYEEAAEILRAMMRSGDDVLLKGSRAMRTENVIKVLNFSRAKNRVG